jgi:hypothetical protein
VIHKANPVSESLATQIINEVAQLLQLFSPQISDDVKE